jgi:hypothetical protein
LIVAGILALGALLLYDRRTVDVDRLDLDPSVQLSPERWNGRLFTAWTVGGIRSLVADYQHKPIAESGNCRPLTILWLGNSQLHLVNQYKVGDHVSPYWLRNGVRCPQTTVPLGVSIPNANFQEHYLLEEYAAARLPVGAIFLELCFDSLRQDGLRADFAGFLADDDKQNLSQSPIGGEMLRVAEPLWKGQNGTNDNAGLKGFVQNDVENRIDSALASVLPLWANRGNMRERALVDLYELRNRMLGISSGTVRKLIPPRYDRNMQALEALLHDAHARGIPVIGYVAPVRNDRPNPYDPVQYAAWKETLQRLLPQYGATYVNLENLVPPNEWGVYDAIGEIDFVHFRNRGHQLVAQALLPYARAAENRRP